MTGQVTNSSESRPVTFVVAWRLNDKPYVEEFDSMTLAWIRMFQLQAYGLEPTIHTK